jgi:hypothetical protein
MHWTAKGASLGSICRQKFPFQAESANVVKSGFGLRDQNKPVAQASTHPADQNVAPALSI